MKGENQPASRPRGGRHIFLVLLPLLAVAVGVGVALRGSQEDRPQGAGQSTGQNSPRDLRSTELPVIPGEEVRRAALGPRGLIVLGTHTGHVRVLTEADGPVRHEFTTDGSAVSALAISRDESIVAAATVNQAIWVWNLESLQTHTVQTTREWSAIALSNDGKWIAAAEFDVAIFDIRAQTLAMTFKQPVREAGSGTYNAVAFSDDSDVVAAVSNEGADSWRLSTRSPAWPTVVCACSADGSALSRNARLAIFGTADGHVLLWDLVAGGRATVDYTVTAAPDDHVYGTGVTTTGERIVAGTANGEVEVWEPTSRTTVGTASFDAAPVVRTDLTEDGTRVLVSIQVDSLPSAPATCNYVGCAVHHRFYFLE